MRKPQRYAVQLCLGLMASVCLGCLSTAMSDDRTLSANVAFVADVDSGDSRAEPSGTADFSAMLRSRSGPANGDAVVTDASRFHWLTDSEPALEDDSLVQPIIAVQAAVAEAMAAGSITLADFEAMALANNPTIQQLAATTQKAAGFRQQVGLRANPIVGYAGTQIADEGTDQHTAFIEREMVTGGKLQLNRRVLNEAVRSQTLELQAQQQRVLTDIRIHFYEALAAQHRVALTTEFQSVGRKGFELAGVRRRAMEASQIEVLQAKIQMDQVDLIKQQAEVASAAAWRQLAALAGNPSLSPMPLMGEWDHPIQPIDWTVTRSILLAGSPEYLAAQARVQQARLYLERQGIQWIPNLTAQLAAGVDNGTHSGLINIQVGAPIPVFNMNQGNIAAARADYCRSVLEVSRIESAIQARLAVASNDFDSALAAVRKYQLEILPSVNETLALSEEAYRAGEFSFLEVLIVRRTYFETSLQYLQSQMQLAQANAKVSGYLLVGGLDATVDVSGDAGLRDQTFSQQ